MRRDQRVVRLGDGGDLLRLQDAAALADVHLDDPDGLLLEQRSRTRTWWRAARRTAIGMLVWAATRAISSTISGGTGSSNHDRVVLLEDLRHADRAGRAELAVRADADLELVADRLADVAEDAGRVLEVLERPVPRVRERRRNGSVLQADQPSATSCWATSPAFSGCSQTPSVGM